ncbi:hypothetical protein B0H13DRAFT_2377227 [Mycena leptocephala]|nr:hypothetical protein B0H13DRAFT_2377227 [Mycena leptocephala]
MDDTPAQSADIPLSVHPLTPTVASASSAGPIVSAHPPALACIQSTRTLMVGVSAVMHQHRYPVAPRDIPITIVRTHVAAHILLAESPCASITLSPAPHQRCEALRKHLQLATHTLPSRARSRSSAPPIDYRILGRQA